MGRITRIRRDKLRSQLPTGLVTTSGVAACLAISGSSKLRTAERDVVREVVVGQRALPRGAAFSEGLAADPRWVDNKTQGACAPQPGRSSCFDLGCT